MKRFLFQSVAALTGIALFFGSCTKERSADIPAVSQQNEEAVLKTEADKTVSDQQQTTSAFERDFTGMMGGNIAARHQQNIVQIAQSLPVFKSLVAAVVKTGLAGTLSSASLNATVFAPADAAFAKLPAPFNNAANISGITNPAQIEALKSILLYHVLGTEVRRNQIAAGRSSAVTLNTGKIYFSNSLGLLFVNGNSLVLIANVDASNGIIHVIDDVLLPPSQTIAQIAVGNPAFSSLVAALSKTNLVGVFTGAGDFTVFAPTDAAFAKLPAPFNNAANISAITNQTQIDALANILKYHVSGSRYFAWDFGIFNSIPTLAAPSSNTLRGILGFDNGWIKGKSNATFSKAQPVNILATNGVVHVMDQVLLP
ncbi:MAG: fasciclin domain-containing protein [Chitinophagaceae bacterium]|nr:fasciclin domain-containing protein [Chitinophagaceae bacterium]